MHDDVLLELHVGDLFFVVCYTFANILDPDEAKLTRSPTVLHSDCIPKRLIF